jgi:hypothetical protein
MQQVTTNFPLWLSIKTTRMSEADFTILQHRTALLRSSYKRERFYDAELLCGEAEENDVLV